MQCNGVVLSCLIWRSSENNERTLLGMLHILMPLELPADVGYGLNERDGHEQKVQHERPAGHHHCLGSMSGLAASVTADAEVKKQILLWKALVRRFTAEPETSCHRTSCAGTHRRSFRGYLSANHAATPTRTLTTNRTLL